MKHLVAIFMAFIAILIIVGTYIEVTTTFPKSYCDAIVLEPEPIDMENYGDIVGRWKNWEGQYIEFFEDGSCVSNIFTREDEVTINGETKKITCKNGTYTIWENGIWFNKDAYYSSSYNWYKYKIIDDILYLGSGVSAQPIEILMEEGEGIISFRKAV